MSAFWIAGIVVNLLALVVVLAWAVRAWKEGERHRERMTSGRARGGPSGS